MDEFDAWLDELQGKGKGTVAHHVLPKGPVDDGVRVNDLLDALQGKPDRFRKLEQAREAEVGQDRPAEFLARRSIPFASSLISYALDEDERKAAARFEAGEPLEWDFPKIARMEARQEAERKTGRAGVGRKVASAVASIPSIVGEMAAAAPLAAPIRAGRFAGAVAPELAAGAGRVAVTTAVAPSMYVEDARRRAQESGGRAIDPENLVPAFAHGAVQTAILGRLGKEGSPVSRAPSVAGRLAARTGSGLLESEVAGAAAKVSGLTTHYGTLTELAKGEGDWADAAAHVVTFAAFSALHARGDEAAKERARNAVLEDFRLQTAKLAGQGFSEKAAGKILKTELEQARDRRTAQLYWDTYDDQMTAWMSGRSGTKPDEPPMPRPEREAPKPDFGKLAEASQKPPGAPQAPEPVGTPPAPPEQAGTPGQAAPPPTAWKMREVGRGTDSNGDYIVYESDQPGSNTFTVRAPKGQTPEPPLAQAPEAPKASLTAPIEATPESTLQKNNVDVDGPLMKGLGLNEKGWAKFQQDNPEVVANLRELATRTQRPRDPSPEERKQYLLDRAMLQGTLNSWKEQAKAPAPRAPVAREAEPVPEAVPEPAAPMDPVKDAIGKLDLNERDRSIIERRMAGETQEAIGASVGLTRERVRQIEAAAMKKAGFPSVEKFKTAAATRARPDKANAEVKGDRAVEDTVQSDIAAKEAMEAESKALQQEVEGLGLKKERGEGELDKEAALKSVLEQSKPAFGTREWIEQQEAEVMDRMKARQGGKGSGLKDIVRDLWKDDVGTIDVDQIIDTAKLVGLRILKKGYQLKDWLADVEKAPALKPHADEIWARAEAFSRNEEYKPAPTRSEGQKKAQESAVAARQASVLNQIRKAGGIDPAIAKEATNVREDAESGLASMYRGKDGSKGRRDPAEVVEELVSEGVIPPLPAEYEYDPLGYLKELVTGKKRSMESDRDKEFARQSEAVDREVAEQAPKAPEAAPYEPEGQRAPVGTKDAAVDAQRAKRGLPPMLKEARKANEAVWDEAQQIIADDWRATDRLIDELLADPRPARSREAAQLLIREVELSNEYHDTLMALGKVREGGNPEQIALFEQSLEDVQARMQRLDEATRKSGAEWGRSGQFRQRLAAENFSLVALEARYRQAGGGKAPATQAEIVREQADLKALAESVQKVKELEAKLEAAQAIAERRAVEEMMDAGDRRTGLKPERERKQTAARKEFSAAVAELRQKSKGLFMNPADPDLVLSLAKVAKAAIKLGVAKVQDFVAEYGKETGKDLNETQVEMLAKAWADAQREIRQERADTALKTRLENEIKSFETQIETGERQVKEKGTGLRSVEAEMLKKKRDAVKAEYEEKFGVAAEKRVGQLEKRLEKWQDRAAGEPAPERKEPVRTKEIEDLGFRIEQAKKEAYRVIEKKRRENRTPLEKVGGFISDLVNIPRLLKFGWDLPPIGRQGLFYTFAHPIQSAKAWAETAPALRKERYERMTHDIGNDPLVKSGAAGRWGLEILDVEGPKAKRSEDYHASWADKIPVLSALGRWNTAYKNRASLNWLHTMVQGMGGEGKVTDAQGKVIANAVNVAMGRGNVNKLDAAFNALNHVFLAPRWTLSRLQMATLQPLWTGALTGNREGTAAARLKVAKELYVRPALGFAAVAGLALAAREYFGKDEIDFDPDGELRVGNRRYDLSAGAKESWVLTNRLLRGEMWTPRGTKRTRVAVLGGTLENKLAPVPGTAVNAARVHLKEPLPGRPKTQAGVALDTVMPVTPKDIYQAFDELGVDEAAATSILNMLGLPGKKYKN